MNIENNKIDYEAAFFAEVSQRNARKDKYVKFIPTMIKFGGEVFLTANGKGLWKNPGHAKLALKNDLNIHFNYWRYKELSTQDKEMLIENIMSKAEFVSVQVSDEMLANLKF